SLSRSSFSAAGSETVIRLTPALASSTGFRFTALLHVVGHVGEPDHRDGIAFLLGIVGARRMDELFDAGLGGLELGTCHLRGRAWPRHGHLDDFLYLAGMGLEH